MRRLVLAGALAGALTLSACASHEPERVDPRDVLDALEALGPASIAVAHTAVTLQDGLTLAEAAALAVRGNPGLAAAWSGLSPLRTQVERADLWADPQLGWSMGDVVGDLSTTPGTSATSFAAGPSLFFEFPRPGELPAKVQVATAQLQQAASKVRALHADVVRDVRLAYAELLVTRAVVAVVQEQVRIAELLREAVATRRATGEATSLDLELANLPVELVHADLPVLEAQAEAARQRLNALIGLPPDARWTPASRLEELEPPAPTDDVEALVRVAVERRPDVAEAVWAHREADAALALERARRWPRLWAGTGVLVELPLFSQFNHYGVKQAARARAAARADVVAAVHRARAEIHVAHARAVASQRVVADHVRPLEEGARRALVAAEDALQAGQLPLIAVLEARARAVAAQRQALEARGAWFQAAVRLQASTGALAPAPLPPYDPDADEDP